MSTYIEASGSAGKRFYHDYSKAGKFVMLNFLKFKQKVDYPPNFATPDEGITGEAAYQKYLEQANDAFRKMGSQIIFSGKSGYFLIGPELEKWDWVLLVAYQTCRKIHGVCQ